MSYYIAYKFLPAATKSKITHQTGHRLPTIVASLFISSSFNDTYIRVIELDHPWFYMMAFRLFGTKSLHSISYWDLETETHICVNKLSRHWFRYWLVHVRCLAIIWTDVGLLSMGPWRSYFNKILIKIQQFTLKRMHVRMSSAKYWPSYLGLNMLIV